MRSLLLVVALFITGCASSPYEPTQSTSAYQINSPYTHGYTEYDPCIRCGEGWIFLNIDDTAHLK